MKKLKLLFVAFALFTISASAFVFNPIKPHAELRAEIVDLLGTNCPYEYDKDECKAEVLFTINSNNELIVLSVNSPNTSCSRSEGGSSGPSVFSTTTLHFPQTLLPPQVDCSGRPAFWANCNMLRWPSSSVFFSKGKKTISAIFVPP